jgi:hypothetical protein
MDVQYSVKPLIFQGKVIYSVCIFAVIGRALVPTGLTVFVLAFILGTLWLASRSYERIAIVEQAMNSYGTAVG